MPSPGPHNPPFSPPLRSNKPEFLAYHLLYSSLYSHSTADVRALLTRMTPGERAHPFVAHALDVQAAASAGNYHRYFALLRTAPNHGRFIMSAAAHVLRLAALRCMVDA